MNATAPPLPSVPTAFYVEDQPVNAMLMSAPLDLGAMLGRLDTFLGRAIPQTWL